jgi:transcriptional regulator with GAF, ATPase, and Fis domain
VETDSSIQSALQTALEDRLQFESLIADLIARFVNLDAAFIDSAIVDAQRRLVLALDLDRSSLFQLRDDDFVLTHYWSRPEFPPVDESFSSARAAFPVLTAKVIQGETIMFSSLSELPPDIPDIQQLSALGAKSSVAFPLIVDGRTIGGLTFDRMRQEGEWRPEIVNRLRLVAEVFASTLAGKRTHDRLSKAVDDRLQFESLVAELISHFVNLDASLIDSAIVDAQRRLVQGLDLDRSSLFEMEDDELTLTHYWSRPEFPPIDPRLRSPAKAFPTLTPRVMRGETIVFSSLDELPPDTPDVPQLKAIGVKSHVAVPLIVAGSTIGVVTFGVLREERNWEPEIVNRLKLIAQVFAATLAGRRAQAELTKEVDDRLRFESVIADIASQFVTLDSEQVDGAIEDAQRRLVEALDVDRSTLLQLVDGGLVFTHFWSRPDVPAVPVPRYTALTWWPWSRSKTAAGELVAFSSLDELPSDMPDREHYERVGTKSAVCLPLIASGRGIGCLTFSSTRRERTWPEAIINRLSLITQVFASALARTRTESELRRALDENATLRDRLEEENIYLQREVKERRGPTAILGQSAVIHRVLDEVDQVAPTAATVLVLGETGTGKELIASAIHERSPRRARPMVRVNCAAIPTALIESELFGHEKGAFTGALTRQTGRFEVADGSTIFLDEIGELPAEVQVKLLRVLQERQIERLGSSRPIRIDVRIVVATNRDLEQMVHEGTFREDLYYRLNVFPIRVPPLRERPEDIPTLAWAFVDEFARAMGKRIESIPKDHMQALQRYPWPGNVRELRNAVERAVIIATGPRLTVHIPQSRLTRRTPTRLDDVEREHIRSVLERTGWRVRGVGGAAELLGLKPSTLEDRMAKLELRRPKA